MRVASEVERFSGVSGGLDQSFLERPLTKMAQIGDFQRLSSPRLHDLHRMGAIEEIGCPQCFMSQAQGVDGLLHRIDVELAAQLQGNGDVVGLVVRCKLMD